MSTDLLPAGEEIWVRRDINPRGRLFYLRECGFVLLALFICSMLFTSLYLNHRPTPSSNHHWLSQAAEIMFFVEIGITLATTILFLSILIFMIRGTRLCPIWYYGEQLNPERLTVYHFHKPPTVIRLAGAKKTNTINVMRHFTTIRLIDKDSNESATLSALTPKEYDRFMHYWNAANPQDKAAS